MVDVLNIPYPDFQNLQIIDPDKFDANNTAMVSKINEVINDNVRHYLSTSSDHDGRYYLKGNVDTLVADLQTQINTIVSTDTNMQGQITANANAINTHKTSTDHDGRYYTEQEVRDYVASQLANYLSLSGDQNINGTKSFLTNPNVPTPISNNHASNKKYVDDTLASVSVGSIIDGSVMDIKLSNDVGQIKDRVNKLETNLTNTQARIFMLGGM